jgi:tRNA(His) 5'-end guanylyltransferase
MNFLRKFKDAELEHRSYLPEKRWAVIRLDGKAFHTYTAGLEQPFDALFMAAMDKTAKELCAAFSGALMGYVQSDEISIVMDTQTKTGFEPVMSGQIQKITSVSAATATGHFNKARWEQGFADSLGVFDSRIALTCDDLEEVGDYIDWRRGDAMKNSVSMAAENHFGHKVLLGKNTVERKQMLSDVEQPWEGLPAGFRYGRYIHRVVFQEDVTFTNKKTKQEHTVEATRSRWDIVDSAEQQFPRQLLAERASK